MTQKTSSKKEFSTRTVIALIVINTVLLAGFIGAIAVYTPMVSNLQNKLAEKDNLIASLNSQIASSENNLLQSQTDNAAQAALIASLQSRLNLTASDVLVNNQSITQNASTYTYFGNHTIQFAGYVSVTVQSNTTTEYVQVVYLSHGVNYDTTITVGTNGTAVFPVLPPLIEIRVGNTNPSDAANATVTATHYY